MVDWEEVELTEVVIAAPGPDEKHIFSGDVSDMWRFVFSDQWADHMYDEYPAYYFEEVLTALKLTEGIVEVELDIVYHFGEAQEEDVREYMLKYKNEGPRFLIMPRTENVTMSCAYLRGFSIKTLDSV